MKVPIKSGPGACIFQPISKIAFAVFIIAHCVYNDVTVSDPIQNPQFLCCLSGAHLHTD